MHTYGLVPEAYTQDRNFTHRACNIFHEKARLLGPFGAWREEQSIMWSLQHLIWIEIIRKEPAIYSKLQNVVAQYV